MKACLAGRRVRRLAVPPTTCRSGCCALAVGLHGERGGTQHDDETRHAEQRVLAHRAEDNQGQASDDHDGGDEQATPRVETRVAGAHGRGELGSSASDRSICSNSRCSCSESGTALLPGRDGPTRRRADRPWTADRLLTRKSTRGLRGSESGTTVERGSNFSAVRRSDRPRRLAGPTTDRPNRAAAASAAASASRQPCSGSPRVGLPRCGPRRAASPSTRTPTSRIRSPGAQGLVNSAHDVSKISRATSVGAARVRERLTVRKSASRTLIDDRAAGLVGPRAAARRPWSASASSARRITAGSATSVSKVTSAPIDFSTCSGDDPARVAAPGQLVQVRGGRLAERARAACRAAPRPRRRPSSGRAGAASRPPSPPRPTARRPAAGAGSRAPGRPGRRSRRRAWRGWSRAWPRTWSAPTPTEQVSRCSSATRGADQRRRSRPGGRAAAGRRPRRGTPRPARAARPAA